MSVNYGSREKVEVVKLLVRNSDGEFLMLRKSEDYDWMSGKWEQPGGKLENNEDRFQAARREMKEETGLELREVHDLVRLEIEDSEEFVNCYVMYTEEFEGDVELEAEHSEFDWVSKQEALELDWHRNAAYILPVIEYLEEYRGSERNYENGEKIKVVKLLIQNEEGDFLAVQKASEKKVHSGHSYTLYGRMAGKWELPGGKFKNSDNRFDAARREVMEETGLELGELKDVVREEIEEENKVDTFILYCKDWKGELELSKEHSNFRWVSPEEYRKIDWHQDAGYGYPPMKFLEEYLN